MLMLALGTLAAMLGIMGMAWEKILDRFPAAETALYKAFRLEV